MRRAVMALALVGCGAGASEPPTRTLDALTSALRSGEVGALAEATGRSDADVTAALADARAELAALGETVARAPVDRSARVVLADGSAIVLVRDGDQWRIDRGALGRPSLGRPADAIAAFHDALVRSRAQAVLAVLAHAPRAELEEQLTRWIDGTADPDAVRISVQGETAVATTPTGERIELVREGGQWRVSGL